MIVRAFSWLVSKLTVKYLGSLTRSFSVDKKV